MKLETFKEIMRWELNHDGTKFPLCRKCKVLYADLVNGKCSECE